MLEYICNGWQSGSRTGSKSTRSFGNLSQRFQSFWTSLYPRSSAIAAGLVIDDFIVCEKLPVGHCTGGLSEGTKRLDRICEEYLQLGLLPHPKKTFRSQSSAEFWGGLCDGVSGHVRPNPKRLIPLTELTSKVAPLGFSTVGLLEVLSGAWISVL